MKRFSVALLILGLVSFSNPSAALAATSGPLNPSSGTSVIGIGAKAWNNPSNVTSSNDGRAIVDLNEGEISNYLKATTFGFAIPVGATINGVQVSIERQEEFNGSSNAKVRDQSVLLVTKASGASATSTNKASATMWLASQSGSIVDATATYGSGSDTWGVAWTPAQVNDSSFGVYLSAINTSSGTNHEARVDNITVTVTYTVASLPSQTITVTTSAPLSATYGNTFPVAATGGASGNPVVITATGGCLISGGTVTMTSGTTACAVKYNQAGNASFAAAPEVTQNVTAAKRAVTITADAKSKAFGAVDPALTYQLTSGTLVGADAFSGSLTRVAGEAAGNYQINQGTVSISSSNYATTYVPANLTIAAPTTGTLRVKKTIVNTGGGTATAADFSFSVNGGAAVAFEVDAQNDLTNYTPGSFTVTETPASGYTAVYSGCTGSVTAGNISTCTITNTYNAPVVVAGNKITNPSFEASLTGNWTYFPETLTGVGSATVTSDSHSGSKAGKIEITSYTSGDLKWAHNIVTVTPNQYYTFSDWYKSDAETEIGLSFNDGFTWVTTLPSTGGVWKQFTTSFIVPAGASNLRVFHSLFSVGTLITDDHSLVQGTAPVFSKGMVSLTFDDGWYSFFENGRPILNAKGLKSTAYVNTDPMWPVQFTGYMSIANIQTLQTEGHEVGGHTTSHADLTLPATNLNNEINANRTFLTNNGITPALSFAYPLGAYNDTVKTAVNSAGYTSARSVDAGYNFTNSDKYTLKIQHVTNVTTFAEAKGWIDTASTTKTWLVLMFHEIVPTVSVANCISDDGSGDLIECSSAGLLQQIADYLIASQVSVPTMAQGVAAMTSGTAPDTIAPIISGLSDTAATTSSKTWVWSANETSTYRFVVDQNPTWTPTGTYAAVTTATQNTGNGTYYLHVQAKDTAGNESAVVTVSVKIETVKPIITLVGAADVNVEINTVYTDAGAAASDTEGIIVTDLTSSIVVTSNVSTSTVGNYTVKYNVSDIAGNAAIEVVRNVHVVDTKQPEITLLGDNPVTIEAGTTYVDAGATVLDNSGATIVATENSATAVSTSTIGSYTVTFTATDASSNATTTTRTVNVQDTVAPVVNVVTPTGSLNATPAITFTVVDATALTIECKVDDGLFATCASPFAPTLATGAHTVTVKATDAALLTGFATTSEFSVDGSAPVITVTNKPGSYASTTSVTIDFTVDDALAVIACTLDGAPSACASGTQVALTSLSEVAHVFVITATDEVSNVTTETINFTVDATAPVITVQNLITKNTTPSVTGTSNDVATVSVGVNGKEYTATPVTNAWAVTIPAEDILVDGTYTVTATSTDAAGNTSVVTGTLVVNTQAPDLTVNAPAVNATAITGTTIADIASVAVSVNGGAGIVATVVDTNWSADLSALTLSDGAYPVSVQATDSLGNIAIAETTLYIDHLAPVFIPADNMTLEATAGSGAVATFALPSFTDTIPNIVAACAPASGSVFALGTTTVTCTADDGVNAPSSISFDIGVIDSTAPVISGPASIDITLGTAFASPVTANDAVDGDMTSAMVVTGDSINVNTLGSYTVVYNVTDAHGNVATEKTLVVNVIATPSRNRGGGGGRAVSRPSSTTTPATGGTLGGGAVLGSSTFKFTLTTMLGSTGNEVTELQKRLTAEGLYTGPITGYFGPMTKAAVAGYQTKNGLPAVGIVGPMTRAKLNGSAVLGATTATTPTMNVDQMKALLAQLQAQLAELMKKAGVSLAN